MIEKKVNLGVLRELLEKRPKPRIIDGRIVFDHLLAEQYQKWIEEFTEAFNQFEKQLNRQLLEKLAALEHEQWIAWSKSIAREEQISPERYGRWFELWIPYEDLTEEQKERDRVWARKVLKVIRKEVLGESEVERK